MIVAAGDDLGEDGSWLRSFFTCRYDGGPLPDLPWGDAEFDCVLVSGDHDRARGLADSFSDEIVKHSVDYVQTTGPYAELIHDFVDEAAVVRGLQHAVGDGSPMTTWHEDARSLEKIVDVAKSCFGGADQVLCMVVGSAADHEQFTTILRDRLSATE